MAGLSNGVYSLKLYFFYILNSHFEIDLSYFTLLRRKPRLRAEPHYGAQARVFRPWMNARRVPFEAPKEHSRVCFGGFRLPARSPAMHDEGRPDEACGGATGFSPWGSTYHVNHYLFGFRSEPNNSILVYIDIANFRNFIRFKYLL